MKPASLSVLITYYNEGELLRRTLESLAAQAEGPERILIYDDASKLPPEPFLPRGVDARVIRGATNQGPGYGRNRLLEACDTDYLHYHDADDLFLPGWARRMRASIAATSPDVVFAEISSYDGDRLVSERVQGLVPMRTTEELVRFCLRHPILTSAGVYRTSLVKKIGGYREALWQSEDYDFHIRLAAQGVRYDIITDPLVRRTRAAGRSEARYEVWSSALQAIELLANELPGKYRRDIAEAAARVASHLFKLGARDEAKRGFQLATSFGPPLYEEQRRPYRLIARVAGPEIAEWVGWAYRRLVSGETRTRLRAKRA